MKNQYNNLSEYRYQPDITLANTIIYCLGKDLIAFRPYYFFLNVTNSLPKHAWVNITSIFQNWIYFRNDQTNRISFSTILNKLYNGRKDGLCLSSDFSQYVLRLVSMRNMNSNGHKHNQMSPKRGERQTFWDILNAGYEHQLPARRQMALFIWMTNISRKHFGSRVENKKHNEIIKWKHFPRYWPFVRGIHKRNPWVTGGVPSQRPVTRDSVFSLICA